MLGKSMSDNHLHLVEPLPRQRTWYAHTLRRFASGRITNFEYEQDAWTLQCAFPYDSTLEAIYDCAWSFYCDLAKHRMTGNRKLTGDAKRLFARMILLLRTGGTAASLSEFAKCPERWPFRSNAEFEAARRMPVFLCGSHRVTA